MKKSLLAAALLFSVDLLAGGCSGYILSPTSKTVYGPSSDWCNTDNSPSDNRWVCPTPYVTQFFYEEYYNNGGSKCGGTRQYYTSVSSCPAGTSKDSNNVCVPPCNGTWNYAYGTCTLPPLSSYDNDPAGCSKAGGTFMSVGTEQVGGTSYGASFFGGQGIVLGGDLRAVTKCGTTSDVVGEVINTGLSLVPFASSLIKSALLKRGLNKNWIGILDKYMKSGGGYDFTPISGKPNNFPDTHVDLPKLPTPSQVQTGPYTAAVRDIFERGISESPVPTVHTSEGDFPSRAPTITVAPELKHIPDAIIPSREGEPYIDYSVVDGGNTIIKATPPVSPTAPQPKLVDIVPSVGTTQKPVKETFDLSSMLPDDYSPRPIIATVPQTTTKSTIYDGNDPVDRFVTTTNYPDGSSAQQTVSVNPRTGGGTISITTLGPDGFTNTTTKPIQTTGYPPSGVTTPSIPDTVTISPAPSTSTAPDGTTTTQNPDGTTTVTAPDGTTTTRPSEIQDGVTNTSPSTNPDTVSNQSPDSIINAVMPSYTLPETGEFVTYDKNIITGMITDVTDTINNLKTQYDAAKTIYDNTLNLVENGWEPPQFSPGQCGNSLTLNWHGKQIDLCPPITQNLSTISPVISLLVTIAGSVIAIGIFIAGF